MLKNFSTTILLLSALAASSSLYALVKPLQNCAQLERQHTVLVVYEKGCGFCRDFLPKYSAVSNEEKFKTWTFYKKDDSTWKNVCGVDIKRLGVPVTFKNNMADILSGDVSASSLEKFLNTNQRISRNTRACKNK